MYVLARLIFDQLNCDYGLLADTSVVSFLLPNSVVIIFRNMQIFQMFHVSMQGLMRFQPL